jgi:hypothetical protein
VLKGLLAGGIAMGVAAVFPEALAFSFVVALLGLMVGLYPGVSMTESPERSAGVQWTVALLVLTVGLVGLWASPLLLAGAWVLHGLWGLLHRITALGNAFPQGLGTFSLAFSLVMASFVAYLWAAGG